MDKISEDMSKLLAEVYKQMAETDRKLKRVGVQLGNISENNGAIAQEYFFNSLQSKMMFLGEHYDDIERNIKNKYKDTQAEIDIVLYNGKSIVIIEVKSKAHKKNLDKILQLATDFRILFPMYKDYKIYLGLASLSFYPEIEEEASELGIAILKQKGDVMEVNTTNIKTF